MGAVEAGDDGFDDGVGAFEGGELGAEGGVAVGLCGCAGGRVVGHDGGVLVSGCEFECVALL